MISNYWYLSSSIALVRGNSTVPIYGYLKLILTKEIVVFVVFVVVVVVVQ